MEKVNIKAQKAEKACELKQVDGATIKGINPGNGGGRPVKPVIPETPIEPRTPGNGGMRPLKDSVKIRK
jgi:hypothetical protein